MVVHDFDPTFGQGRYCSELVRHLHPDIHFTIISNTYNAPRYPGVDWIRIPTFRPNALSTVFSFIPPAQRAIRRIRPDLVHAQGLTSWSADIITGHICNGVRLTKHNTRWIRPRVFTHLISPIERAFYRQPRARRLIAISQTLANDIRSAYGWDKAVNVIYHGTECEQFRPCIDEAEKQAVRARFNAPQDAWLWLFMGEAVKGLRQAIDQLKHFPSAHLLVISRSNFDRYRQQAQDLGVIDRVIFHGFSSCSEEAFRAADFFLYASDYDPFGMVVTEAMASGLPVAVGHELGAAEIIEGRVNGLVFDPHDADAITKEIQWLLDHPEKGRLMGIAARETITGYGWDRCARETHEVYREELALHGTRHA